MTATGSGQTDPQAERLSDGERLAWLRLIRSEQVGARLFHDLRVHFKDMQAALEALPELSRRGGARGAIRICPPDRAEAELAAASADGARFVGLGEADYPRHLATVDGPPPLLAIKGDAAIVRRDAVAIVGARNCSAAGARFAARIAGELGDAGFAVVSGLARGIDAAAHRASLQTGTIAVLAGGLDRIYPPEHDRLVEDILAQKGCILSEMPFGHVARGKDFPRRNRIISGIGHAAVVIEAARRSGTLHTARFALQQNREVFAAPGAPLDPRSEGCNDLIRQGAHLLSDAAQICEVLAPITGRDAPAPSPDLSEDTAETMPPAEPAGSERETVVQALGTAPVTIDELIRHTALSPRTVHMILLELDLAGRIEHHGNQLISLQF